VQENQNISRQDAKAQRDAKQDRSNFFAAFAYFVPLRETVLFIQRIIRTFAASALTLEVNVRRRRAAALQGAFGTNTACERNFPLDRVPSMVYAYRIQ